MSHESPLLDQKLESSKENFNEEKIQRLPYDKSVFWTGLIGMILCLAPGGIIGLVLIKISLNRAKTANKLFEENAIIYNDSSVSKIKLGMVFSYMGICFFILGIIGLLIYMR
jgi:hypothetical protein